MVCTRSGWDLKGKGYVLTSTQCREQAEQLVKDIADKKPVILRDYKTCLDKDLKQLYNHDQRMRDLVDILSMCAQRKVKAHHMLSTLIKICNYDINKLWIMVLKPSYPDINL